MNRTLIQACALATIALSLAGCVYSEEASWRDCCTLSVVTDEPSIPPGQKPMIDWLKATRFAGDGSASDSPAVGRDSDKVRRIKAGITEFFVSNPGVRAHEYFLSLGMTCRPAVFAPRVETTRCEIDLPVWVKCQSKNMLPGVVPPPKEFRKPIPALLRLSLDVSDRTVLDVRTRIDPVPGGRLCHR